jgi:hypothetical protein
MRILSFIAFIFLIQVSYGQSPHESSLKYDCSYCHQSADWKIIPSDIKFDHNKTNFPLAGQHVSTDCRSCHTQLKFLGTPQNCSDCHKDIHRNTVGFDCAGCHTPQNWLVKNINELHQKSRFPLTGVHIRTDCQDCHAGFTNLSFEVQGVRCYDCHRQDYLNTTQPDHAAAGFSTECQDCHSVNNDKWSSENFKHDFFPLIGGHSVGCFSCHIEGRFTGLSRECIDCHQTDYNASVNPRHTALAIPVTCQDCHSVNPGWQPAAFPIHDNYYIITGAHLNISSCITCHNGDYNNTPNTCFGCHSSDYNNTTNPPHQTAGFSTECLSCHSQNAWIPSTFDHDNQYFPIFSGKHRGEWENCSDCHITPSSFSIFSCIDCHEHNKPDMDEDHEGIGGYVYASQQCYNCHPTGEKGGAFNHNLSNFPLTGAHINVNCQSCHQTGYAGTTTVCFDCHQQDYTNSTNPSHTVLQLSSECSSCHTTNPDWQPALFPQHDQYYPLTGSHLQISQQCASCHNGNYISTPNQCIGCHQSDYSNAQNPNHTAAGISNLCSTCHTTVAWIPSLFNHSTTGFPLTGQHSTTQCSSCHEGTTSGLNNACISCHQSDYNTAPGHVSQNYPVECGMCHNTTAWNQTTFNHSATSFPLTGAHINVNCQSCHQTGFTGTTTVCFDCHQQDYTNSTNPSHSALQLSSECSSCHTTNPDWQPALFPVHNNYYPLLGAHAALLNDCSGCHNGDYNNTPNTCFGCHETDYNTTTNPPHLSAGFPTECQPCHTQNSWTPSTFNHDNQYFPIYSGKHRRTWDQCSDCHINPNNFSIFSCITCHEHNKPDMDDEHEDVAGYIYESNACFSCHPDGEDKAYMPRLNEVR